MPQKSFKNQVQGKSQVEQFWHILTFSSTFKGIIYKIDEVFAFIPNAMMALWIVFSSFKGVSRPLFEQMDEDPPSSIQKYC